MMFIETEETPNPATLKFLPGRKIVGDHASMDFADKEATLGRSELAEALFAVPEVKRVFLGQDFVSITKKEESHWSELRPILLAVLKNFFQSARPVLSENAEKESQLEAGSEEDKEIIAKILELLETRVRPAVAEDGGDIVFRGYRDGVVYLMMQGACSGCPSSRVTLRHGVENMLRHYVPEIVAVEAVEE